MIRIAQGGKLEVFGTTDQTDQSNVCACVAVQEFGTEDPAGTWTFTADELTTFEAAGGTLGVAVLTGLMLNRFRDGVAEVAASAPLIANNADAFLNEQGVARVREVYQATSPPGSPPFEQLLIAIQTPLADAIAFVFLLATIIVGLSVVVTIFIPEIPLRTVSPADMIRRMQQEHAESRDEA